MPEPIVTAETLHEVNPAEWVDANESITLAFLTLLEHLQPFERAVFLLREVFDYDYAEVAAILDRKERACRKASAGPGNTFPNTDLASPPPLPLIAGCSTAFRTRYGQVIWAL